MVAKASDVIARFGGQSALARALGVNQSTVQHWAKTGQIPSWRREQVLRAAQAQGIPLRAVEVGAAEGGPNAQELVGRLSGARTAQGSGRLNGLQMGFVRGAAPGPPTAAAVPHGRAEFIPNVDGEIGVLRQEIAQLRAVVERLVEEIAALRGSRKEGGSGRQRAGKSRSGS